MQLVDVLHCDYYCVCCCDDEIELVVVANVHSKANVVSYYSVVYSPSLSFSLDSTVEFLFYVHACVDFAEVRSRDVDDVSLHYVCPNLAEDVQREH